MSKIRKPQSLTAIAREKIRRGIMTGEFPLGASLFEKALADEFGISKTPVREALVQLQKEGLVIIRPHSGTFVFDPTERDIWEMCECREILETSALRIAYRRDPDRLLAELAKQIEHMQAATRQRATEKYREFDAKFHLSFFDLSDNAYLRSCYSLMESKIAALRVHLIAPRPNEPNLSLQEHEQIRSNLTEGNIRRAVAVLKAHITRSGTLYSNRTPE